MDGKETDNRRYLKKFIIFSVIGFAFFLLPIPDQGSFNILVNWMTTRVEGVVAGFSDQILFAEFTVAMLGSLAVTLFFKHKYTQETFLGKVFSCGPVDLVCRIVGSLLFFAYYFGVGPELFLSEDVAGSLMSLLLTVGVGLGIALILMPLLTDFGMMEFLGTLLNKGVRLLFRLPGRAAVDLLSSWFGMVQVGLLISEKQYINGFYTKREVSVIASCFTATGIGFWIVCGGVVGVSDYIMPFFAAIFLVGFSSAVVMTRIPPLSLVPDDYYIENENNIDRIEAEKAKGKTTLEIAADFACETAKNSRTLVELLAEALLQICRLIAGLLPSVMLLGTVGLMLAHGTELFYYLGKPFEWVWNLCQLPEGAIAGPALISGLADMFLPMILGAGAASVRARFVIGVIGMVQIIYFSEVISYIVVSKIPLKIWQMIVIFFEKTLIAIPIAALAAVLFNIPA